MAKRQEAKTVLVIEDDAGVRDFASRVLKLEGYHVLQAKNGETGLKLVKEGQPALVLLDLRLPGRDGWAVVEEMRAEPELSAIPVIVFSASVEVSQREKALSVGVADYLVKPLSASTLRESVACALHWKPE